MLGLVDWELLVLFAGLFVVNHAFQQTGLTAAAVNDLAGRGVHLEHPGPLFVATLILSNTVSNVPAVMLLLPVASHALGGPLLALVSTLAGNLFIVGSIASIIVVDAAARRGIAIDWRTHAGGCSRHGGDALDPCRVPGRSDVAGAFAQMAIGLAHRAGLSRAVLADGQVDFRGPRCFESTLDKSAGAHLQAERMGKRLQ